MSTKRLPRMLSSHDTDNMRALQLAAVLDEALVLSRTGLTSLRFELLHHIHPAVGLV